jgi:hypothetical protein
MHGKEQLAAYAAYSPIISELQNVAMHTSCSHTHALPHKEVHQNATSCLSHVRLRRFVKVRRNSLGLVEGAAIRGVLTIIW